MIKVIMTNGTEYELNYKSVDSFIKDYIGEDLSLSNKIVSIKDDISINLMAIASIEEEKYIDGIDTIIP